MEYPLITHYKEAVQFDSFESPELQCLRPVMNGSDPVMTSGNYAVVFKMHNPQTGECFALKCFTQDQDGRAEAYRQIEAELRYLDSPYFIGLKYIDKGIWAGDNDQPFPVVLMPWVDGEPLDHHINRLSLSAPERLHLVAYKFSVMASWLVNQPFAHGDIKPDNILVRADGSMVLVDYDGLFVPSMLGTKSREAGTPAFRHPNRPTMPFDERIDDFPLASINLSLYLIALNPNLLRTHGAKDRLLFSETDYINMSQCPVVAEISKLNHNPHVQRLYALFLIALSEGSLQRCENRLMLLPPPSEDFKIQRLAQRQTLPHSDTDQTSSQQRGLTNPSELIFNANGVEFKMEYVEGGTFMMGAPDSDTEAWDDEKPQHSVTLDAFYMAETQVTQELWYAVMGRSIQTQAQLGTLSHDLKGVGTSYPMYYISWDDCQEFIKKLNQLTGKSFSLPTEAQWEYAARGGRKSQEYKYAGGNNLDIVSWYDGNSNSQPHPVAQKQANELGLYDMTGNVWEWCQDWFSSDYYSNSPQQNPMGPVSGSYRVLRGGSWSYDPRFCRVSFRSYNNPGHRHDSGGLRLLLPV